MKKLAFGNDEISIRLLGFNPQKSKSPANAITIFCKARLSRETIGRGPDFGPVRGHGCRATEPLRLRPRLYGLIMFLSSLIQKLYRKTMIWYYRRQGLVMARDCRMSGLPHFGSEPYLISIGKHVALSRKVAFVTHDGGTYVFREQERYKKVIKYGRITVLDNCVIGRGAIILPGVSIGPNSVVGAGSVVNRNVPPNTLVAGNPAKPVMSITQYAEWALAATPDYDEAEYMRDKKSFLLKMRMRGAPRPNGEQP